MTVYQMMSAKYQKWLKEMGIGDWENILRRSEDEKAHPAEIMYLCLEITADDIRKNGGFNGELYEDILRMHEAKLLASNKHRQARGQVTKYWLTKKGLRELNREHQIS